MKSNLHISKPTLYLCAFIFIAQIVYGFSAAQGNEASTGLSLWYFLTFYWAIGWWFINDSRGYGIKWIDDYMDTGLFLYVAWIFILPYYLFKSRGWRAFYTIMLLLGIYFGAYIAGVIVYLLTSI